MIFLKKVLFFFQEYKRISLFLLYNSKKYIIAMLWKSKLLTRI